MHKIIMNDGINKFDFAFLSGCNIAVTLFLCIEISYLQYTINQKYSTA